MEHVDPYKVMRNTRTLETYRARQRAAWGAAQPFATIALIAWIMAIPLTGSGVFGHRLGQMLLHGELMLAVGGLAFLVGVIRMRRYLKRHPPPPELRGP